MEKLKKRTLKRLGIKLTKSDKQFGKYRKVPGKYLLLYRDGSCFVGINDGIFVRSKFFYKGNAYSEAIKFLIAN